MRRLLARMIQPSTVDGDVLTTVSGKSAWAAPGTGGGGGVWNQDLSLPLTSLTNWTPGAGTWTAEVDRIRQAATDSSVKRLHYGPKLRLAHCVIEIDVRINVSTNVNSSRAGLSIGTPRSTDGNGASLVALLATSSTTTTHVDYERESITNYGKVALAAPIAHGTWMTFRVEVTGFHFTAFVNDTLVSAGAIGGDVRADIGRLALYSYATDCSFRNLKVWSPVLP